MKLKLKDWIEVRWHIEDVRDLCEQRPSLGAYNLSDEDCRAILARAKVCHDANCGINWDVLDSHIEDYVKHRDARKAVSV